MNHIATINESTSKAVKMYKAFDDEMENDDRQAETPLLFIIGDKLKGEEENGGVEKNVKKPVQAWDDKTTKKESKRVTLKYIFVYHSPTSINYFYKLFRQFLPIK